MTYTGNQLTHVTEAAPTVTMDGSNDFRQATSIHPAYTYNQNGAMTKDLNKKITSITYNTLSLPESLVINGETHNYNYAADGRKLRVEQGKTNRDYVGNIIYENGSLKRILVDGGYWEEGSYYNYVNDHLGNVRVVACETGAIAQQNDYYPFGMPMAENTIMEQDKQPYKYNGKEFQRKDGLNLKKLIKWFRSIVINLERRKNLVYGHTVYLMDLEDRLILQGVI